MKCSAADPQRVEFRGARRQDRRHCRTIRRRQVDGYLPPFVPPQADVSSGRILNRRSGYPIRSPCRLRCAPRSAWCRRTRCCSTTPSVTTSDMAAGTPPTRRWSGRAQLAQIDGFIRMSPKGYETHVGERGLEIIGRRETASRDCANRAQGAADSRARRGDNRRSTATPSAKSRMRWSGCRYAIAPRS